ERLGTGPNLVVVCPVLNFTCSKNEGGVFGFGQGQRGLFVFLSLGAMAAICWLLLRSDMGWLGAAAMGLILGGAIGNLYDRIALGYVRDFIDFHIGNWHWYTFNVADALICIGVVPLMLKVLWQEKGAGKEA
ncbi:MAG: signal peptidase II, partial [Planctomycetes bacterium]|nr:signal peptidase II [Planctomycetota bacterium]